MPKRGAGSPRYLLPIALVAGLAVCGGTAKRDVAPRPQRPAELASFQRNGGLAATLDNVVVRSDAGTRADKRYGRAGRRCGFRLGAAVMARLSAPLRRLPPRAPAVGEGTRMGVPA